MALLYHTGELAVQTRVGRRDMADRIGRGIHSSISPVAQDFLRAQRMAVVSTVDASGRVWASLLTGIPGFIHAVDEQTVQIAATPVFGDPLGDNLRAGADVGLLVIDLAKRRRMRVNGKAEVRPEGRISVRTSQVYANCPKYIQTREWEPYSSAVCLAPDVHRSTTLTTAQQDWITRADTFFVASFHGEGGADASHRGGNPGFIGVLNESTLMWPDYAGNNMFQTLGNIAANPHAGLLFVDFVSGRTLQLTGTARLIWDADRVAEFMGAERLVEFHSDQAVEIAGTNPWRWRLVEYSPFNPA